MPVVLFPFEKKRLVPFRIHENVWIYSQIYVVFKRHYRKGIIINKIIINWYHLSNNYVHTHKVCSSSQILNNLEVDGMAIANTALTITLKLTDLFMCLRGRCFFIQMTSNSARK